MRLPDGAAGASGQKAEVFTKHRIASKENTVMTTFDFSPLFRTSVGFDRLASMLNSAHRVEQGGGYPPYNIQTAGENRYRITMAVAGFSEAELKITSELNKLIVTGEKADESESDDNSYLYRGIATRSFERRFNLADHVRVSGARLDNGLLHIELEREIPEAMKPRNIEIQGGGNLLESEVEDKAA
jgi:molecular chaperone IbpA